ncbi:hypothetical protein NDU88_004881 [Pleurodeles waltl]|uniref:Uncharacterized protein n=1 Tax=Pleurodeles waltl TaxID=8319 RepID=A0AAV7WWD3_PLEWA|nr:hypothetical protein NDU88_004881 [Pleurodeles waltl]
MALHRPAGVTGRGGGRLRRRGGRKVAPPVRRLCGDSPAPRQASPLESQPQRFQERFQALGPEASPPTRARGVPGAARGPGSPAAAGPSRRTGRSRASLQNPRPGTGQGTWQRGWGGLAPTCMPAVRPPGSRPLRVESFQSQGGRPEPCQPAGTSPPTCPGGAFWEAAEGFRAGALGRSGRSAVNDPSAGSPTETLL